MQSTPGKRLLEWREFKGITLAEMARLTGVSKTTISSSEQAGSSNPSYDTIMKVLTGFPDLNPDWLLLGTGSMLRDGRALVPAAALEATPGVKEPAPDYSSGPATEQTAYISVLKEQVADLKADKVRNLAEIDRLREALGKPFDGSDAAGLPVPTPPRNPVGFGAAERQARAAAFNAFVEAQLGQVVAAEPL